MVSVVVFALSGAFWLALILFWTVAFLREVREPVFAAWLNRGLDPSTRARVNSFAGQMDAFGQIAGGPTMGAVSVGFGVPAEWWAGGVDRRLITRALAHGPSD